MNNDTKNCSQCGQKDRCGLLYEKMGNSGGPNVAWKAVVALLIPIVVFILSLVAAEKLLKDQFNDKTLTIICFIAALGVTITVVFLIRAIQRPFENKPETKHKS